MGSHASLHVYHGGLTSRRVALIEAVEGDAAAPRFFDMHRQSDKRCQYLCVVALSRTSHRENPAFLLLVLGVMAASINVAHTTNDREGLMLLNPFCSFHSKRVFSLPYVLCLRRCT
jgi:hypothetical protein